MTQSLYKNWQIFRGIGGDIKDNDNYFIKRKTGNIIDIIHILPIFKHTDKVHWVVEKANNIDLSFLNSIKFVKNIINEYGVRNWADLPLLSKVFFYYRYYPYKFDSKIIYFNFNDVLNEFGKCTEFERTNTYSVKNYN
ncbi:MAG: hypothetical protein ACTSWY_03555 [Promethearchaeota archaeon]